MMSGRDAQEEAKLNAMQRVWQQKRGMSSALFEDASCEELLVADLHLPSGSLSTNKAQPCAPDSASLCKEECIVEAQYQDQCVPQLEECLLFDEPTFVTLDASKVGDLPARYQICPPESHQMPVIGVYMDPRIVPGFKYRVRPLPCIDNPHKKQKCLFNERALTLTNIGRGFARRFTFEADKNNLNNNENYFYSDNRPEGYAFELEIISEGDKFTIFNANKEPQGTLEVLKVEGAQIEISSTPNKHGVEKRASVRFTGKVEFYETGVAKPMPLAGVAIALKSRNKANAEIVKVLNVAINRHRYSLMPGIHSIHRRVTVKGQDINDVPTKYTMTGLEPYEIPVVGTYVDPRVVPGFCYKVRPNDRKEHLFGGRALKLLSIGMGYAKRLTFEPDSLVDPDNYLWSDNHPDGLGLEIKAVRKGMKFSIVSRDQVFGEAIVFRDDRPQQEEKMEIIDTADGKRAIEKHILIDVMCHVRLGIPGGLYTSSTEEQLMRVCGVAVVRKAPNRPDAQVLRVFNVGLDSQLNVLFAQTKTELTFYPK